MARWPRGEAEIERLLSLKHVQAVTGAAANGRPLLTRPTERWRLQLPSQAPIPTARSSSPTTPLATPRRPSLPKQGLRATTSGGHVAVESAIRRKFGDGFRNFGFLRRRRNEL